MHGAAVEVVIELLNVLVELVQGPCPLNQLLIASSSAMDVCKKILQTTKMKGQTSEHDCDCLQRRLKGSSIKLIVSTLESRSDKLVHSMLIKVFEPQIFQECMVSIFHAMNVEATDEEATAQLLVVGFDLFCINNRLSTFSTEFAEKMTSSSTSVDMYSEAHAFLQEKIRCVEVVCTCNQLLHFKREFDVVYNRSGGMAKSSCVSL
jgi:hypothetical protein